MIFYYIKNNSLFKSFDLDYSCIGFADLCFHFRGRSNRRHYVTKNKH